MPYFWTESDSGVPSDSPPKLTGKKKLLESLPKPLIFNIFSAKKWMQVLFYPLYQSGKKEGNYPTLLRIRGNYLLPSKKW